jgi:membrane fusion protein (multidrug efflux system)
MKRNLKPTTNQIIWILIGVMLVLIIVSMTLRRHEEIVPPPPEPVYPVEVMTLIAQERNDDLLLPGRIEPSLRTHLPVDKPGRITRIHVDRGASVTNGQLLLEIDDRIWKALLDAAEIEWREASDEAARWNDLDQAGAVSESDLDRIRNRLNRAEVNLREVSAHLSQCRVFSPANGIINERFVEEGEHAPEGKTVFELVVNDPVTLLLDVPERQINHLQTGQSLVFTVAASTSSTATGTVTFIAAAARPENNAFKVEVRAANPDGTLKPGMIAEVRIPERTGVASLAVPLDAIIPRRGEYFVFVAADGRAVRRLVRIGKIHGASTIIEDGLREGDVVIVKGNRDLVDGALIRIANQP